MKISALLRHLGFSGTIHAQLQGAGLGRGFLGLMLLLTAIGCSPEFKVDLPFKDGVSGTDGASGDQQSRDVFAPVDAIAADTAGQDLISDPDLSLNDQVTHDSAEDLLEDSVQDLVDVGNDFLSQDTTEPECQSAAQCQHLAADAGLCEKPECEDGVCLIKAVDNGTFCSDDNPCTVDDACLEGVCIPGENTCACNSTPDCAGFEDGDLCNGTLVCEAEVCVVDSTTIVECDTQGDGECELTACVKESGLCEKGPLPLGAGCEDGDLCTSGDHCVETGCVASGQVNCNDGNSCTLDSCDPLFGCAYQPLDAVACYDGNSCTINDSCQEGLCVGGQNGCVCEEDEDCAPFEDGNACNGVLTCQGGFCEMAPDSVVVCQPSLNPCTTISCDTATGICAESLVESGTPCDDGNLCTAVDTCETGVCTGQLPVSCSDEDPCTHDGCEPSIGCVFTSESDVPCEDGNGCTEGDSCQAGVCVPGANLCSCISDGDCLEEDDGDPCNGRVICIDSTCQLEPGSVVVCNSAQDTQCVKNICQSGTGECELTQVADGNLCNDGDPCTTGDACFSGECGGLSVICDDGNPCTDDYCALGTCMYEPNALLCNDSNPCTLDDACVDGACIGDALDCDDGKVCTFDTCLPSQGCVHQPLNQPCDDGNVCTEGDSCQQGQCVAGAMVECNDDVVCTTDSCDPDTGCLFKANDLACDDQDPCTQDWCDLEVGCRHLFQQGNFCDDGDPCTVNDVCHDNQCSGVARDCTDFNPCTLDSCAGGQCVNSPAPDQPVISCDDGNPCTLADTCFQGVCTGGPAACDDSNPCTDDFCSPTGQCSHLNNSNPCNDGNLCTQGDTCSAGQCRGTAKNCSDGNVCTDDLCDQETGLCEHPGNTASCSDGNDCTQGDACSGGVCVSGQMICQCQSDADCQDDGDPCNGLLICQSNECRVDPTTIPVCDQTMNTDCLVNLCVALSPTQAACELTPVANGTDCDDEDVCTTSDVCTSGACSGTAVVCNQDENPCTLSVCQPDQGCVVQATNAACDDQNPCTVEDHCSNFVCTGPARNCDDGNSCTIDACDRNSGCYHKPAEGFSCDDGNPCTDPDLCSSTGQCLGVPVFGCCTSDTDCDPGYPCEDFLCQANQCVYTPLDCKDQFSCTTDWCEEGICNHQVANGKVSIYFEDFESEGDRGWTFQVSEGATNKVFWSVDSYRTFAGEGALYAGNPEERSYDFGVVDAWARSPYFVVPETDFAFIRLAWWADVQEQTYDYDFLEVLAIEPAHDPVVLTPRLYKSTSGLWKTGEFDLTPFVGRTIQIGLRFSTKDADSNVGEGFYVDDVQVVAGGKEGCCATDLDCDDRDLCTSEVCQDDFQCSQTEVPGSFLWDEVLGTVIPTGWTRYSNNTALSWGVSEEFSVTTPRSYGCVLVGEGSSTGASASLETPELDLGYAVSPRLGFQLKMDAADSSCSSDVFLVTVFDVLSGEEGYEVYSRCTSTGSQFIGVDLDLQDFAGKRIAIQLSFMSEKYVADQSQGAWVDSIRLYDEGLGDSCCTAATQCQDYDICSLDLCVGQTNGGLCTNPPYPGLVEDFDDGVADGWTTIATSTVFWHIDPAENYSAPNGFHASKSDGTFTGQGVATAFTKPLRVKPAGPGNLYYGLHFKTDYAGLLGKNKFEIIMFYRTEAGGEIQQGGVLLTQESNTDGWEFATGNIPISSAYYEIALAFKFTYTNLFSSCMLNCPKGVMIDDVMIGWDGCKFSDLQ